MTLHLLLKDLANYSVQIAAVITAGSVAPLLLRVRRPDVMLIFRQMLLAACLLLPFLQPWSHPATDSSVTVSVGMGTVTNTTAATTRHFSWEETAALLLCAGMLARLGWLAIGFARLRRYRNRAEVLIPLPPVFDALQRRLDVWPSICLSSEVSGPVTFGIAAPVILLPPEFLSMPYAAQEAIACHELTHVRRRDWAAAMLEELVRALLWFHPAIWWLLGQIQLAREQTVDAQVIRITASRKHYIDALLAVAGGDLAPATLFLRKTHLAQRIAIILKEVSMSKKHLLSSLAAVCGALVITARFATFYFPISAPAQEVVKGGDNLLHRAPIEYPPDAIEKGIQGTVVVEATLNDRGVVTDARVISGPDLLRRAALKSVLDWHYTAQTQSPVEVAVDFKMPIMQMRIEAIKGAAPAAPHKVLSGTLREIKFPGVPPSVIEAVHSKLPIHVGDRIEADVNPYGQFIASLRQAIEGVDEHLGLNLHLMPHANDDQYDFILEIHYKAAVAQAVEPILDAQGTVGRIRVGGNVQAQMAISAPPPVYPPLAKQARVQGVVRLNAVIGKDGTVQDLKAASGHPLLVPAALEAVRQWIYKPTLLNGSPVEVVTVVDINFTLSQ